MPKNRVFGRSGGVWPNDSFGKVLTNYIWVVLSKLFRTSVVLYGIEVTEIRNTKTKNVWSKTLSKVDWVVTRTKHSKMILSDLTSNIKESILFSPDITFAIGDSDVRKYLKSTCKRNFDKNYILWALAMPWSKEELKEERYQKRYYSFISTIIEVNKHIEQLYPDCTNLLVPFLHPGDKELAKDLISAGFNNAQIFDGDFTEIRSLFSRAKLAIDMRFHSVVFSLYENCPFVAISYSPKTTDILKDNSIAIHAEINQTIVVGWITSSNIILNCSISRGIYAE